MSGLQARFTCAGDKGFSLDVDCLLPTSGVIAIHGPSGSGKSTLLDCIAGLRTPEPGGVLRMDDTPWLEEGKTVPAWDRNIGYVFQDARLFSHLDVRNNLQFAIRRAPAAGGPELAQVSAWLELDDLLGRDTETLSAGQKQRVAIARALLSNPRLLLLDEPLANLDHAARQQCLHCLQRLGRELELPMLYVSHDIEEVSQIADQLVLLETGRIVEQGPLLELCSRLDTHLSHEEQAAAILSATVAGQDQDFGLTRLEVCGHSLWVNHLEQPTGQGNRVRIPARDVSICRQHPKDTSILNILPVTISEIEDTPAPRLLLRLSLGDQYLLARITRKSAASLDLKVGDSVFAQIKSAALLMDLEDTP